MKYHQTKWKQASVLPQAVNLQKLRRFNIETTSKKPRGEFIGISSILKVESKSSYPRRVDVILSTRSRLS